MNVLRHRLPDGRVVERQTQRGYTHVVVARSTGRYGHRDGGPNKNDLPSGAWVLVAWSSRLELAMNVSRHQSSRGLFVGCEMRVEPLNGGGAS